MSSNGISVLSTTCHPNKTGNNHTSSFSAYSLLSRIHFLLTLILYSFDSTLLIFHQNAVKLLYNFKIDSVILVTLEYCRQIPFFRVLILSPNILSLRIPHFSILQPSLLPVSVLWSVLRNFFQFSKFLFLFAEY